MGRVFLLHVGGEDRDLVLCGGGCNAILSNRSHLMNRDFCDREGEVSGGVLFHRVDNLRYNIIPNVRTYDIVRHVFCKKCDTKLGWTYEFTKRSSERYMEGRVLLEKSKIIVPYVQGQDDDIEEIEMELN